MIELNTKDADFIAKAAREELKKIAEAEESFENDVKKADLMVELLRTQNPGKETDKLIKHGEDIKKKARAEIKVDRDKWEKVLTLVMEGSSK